MRAAARAAAVAALCALTADAPPATASAPELYGFGMRAPAMAGTGVAFADDWEAVYANPAGVAHGRRRRVSIGYAGASHSLTLDGREHPQEPSSAVLLGAELPLPLGGALADRLALALGFYLPTDVVNRARAPLPDVPRLLHDHRAQVLSVMGVAAARLPRGVSAGAGVIALAALVGGLELTATAGGNFGARSDQRLIASYAPLVGLRWDGPRALHVGLVYRGESLSRYDIAVENSLGAALPLTLPALRIAGVNQYDPHTVAVEAALGQPAGALIALQAQWQHWSAMPPAVEPVTAGSPAGPRPDLRDSVTLRCGVQWGRTDGVLTTLVRAGYAFVLSPAPDQAPARAVVDADRHVVGFGLELLARHRVASLRLSAFYQAQVLGAVGPARAGGWFSVGGAALGIEL